MKLLVVCLGNICRSPLAEGALRAHIEASHLANRVEVDSAGTGHWHQGEPPDRRAIACASTHGMDISGQRARQLNRADFDHFDWLLCADASVVRDVLRLAMQDADACVLGVQHAPVAQQRTDQGLKGRRVCRWNE